MDINRMSIKEFREEGFLQEANRKFFHPLGLALEVTIDDDTGEEHISSIWDYRHDPEGMLYGKESISREKIVKIEKLRLSKIKARIANKYVPVGEDGIQV